MEQDKLAERSFFASFAEERGAYDVFSPATNESIVDRCVALGGFPAAGRVVDVGCGSGVFTAILRARGFHAAGMDISPELIAVAAAARAGAPFAVADAERLPIGDEALDGALLSGIVHHLPDPSRCLREVHRVLRPGASFVAFDPNRRNPFMFLYRDHASPIRSRRGVTENERPILEREARRSAEAAGFEVTFDYLSGLTYTYVESTLMRIVLPLYNRLDAALCRHVWPRTWGTFILTRGRKRVS